MIGFFIVFRVVKVGYFWFFKEWGEGYDDKLVNVYCLYVFGLSGYLDDF